MVSKIELIKKERYRNYSGNDQKKKSCQDDEEKIDLYQNEKRLLISTYEMIIHKNNKKGRENIV